MGSDTSREFEKQPIEGERRGEVRTRADRDDADDAAPILPEHLSTVLTGRTAKRGPARILLVGGAPGCQGELRAWLKRRRHRCTTADRLDEARAAIARCRFDLMILNPHLPDGDGLELARLMQKTSPTAKTIVFSDDRSSQTAIGAMRCGAVDFLNTPIDFAALAGHIDAALIRSRLDQQREASVTRLKRICQELNSARHEMSQQVESLCGDLISAYRELADQIGDVAMAAEFRTLLKLELDVEELLRTTLEYMLTKTGPTNAAVFLPEDKHHYSLGAYVNYDCPRESLNVLLDHLCQAICPQMALEEEIIAFDDAEEFGTWIGLDPGLLSDSQVIAFSCVHEGECLAVVVLFRNKEKPFDEKLAGMLDILRTVFAEQLATVIRVHHRASPSWPKEAEDDELDLDEEYGGLAA